MKRTIVTSILAFVFGFGGSVGAALFLPIAPPFQSHHLLATTTAHRRLSMRRPSNMRSTIEDRVLTEALVLSQA